MININYKKGTDRKLVIFHVFPDSAHQQNLKDSRSYNIRRKKIRRRTWKINYWPP